MKRLILAVAALAAVSACSDSRERSVPVVEQPDRTLQVARPDSSDKTTSEVAARSEQPVSPVEQQPSRPEPKAKPTLASRAKKAAAARPKPAVDTTSARGYAPKAEADTSSPDTSSQGDTSSAQPSSAVSVTAPHTVSETAADTAAVRRDTMSRDTVSRDTTVRDTVARTDTASARDTVASARRDSTSTDTALASADTGAAAPKPAARAANSISGLDLEQRTLPIGTEIHAALDDSISSRHDTAGRSITAQITQSVTGPGGKVLIPAGSTVRLTVARLAAAHSKSSQGRLGLTVDGIEMGGQVQKVQADLRPVPRELRGRGVTGSEAAKVGAGAAGGAVVGGVVGGNTKGAVIGGVIGAAGGAVVASQTSTRDVVVKAKTPVTFVLTEPLVAR